MSEILARTELTDHAEAATSTGKLPVEVEKTSDGTLWIAFGPKDRDDDRAFVMIEHYEGKLVVRTYRPVHDEPLQGQGGIVLMPNVDEYLSG